MSWQEVRAQIGDTLPPFMGEKNGFPTPDNPDFWQAVLSYEEIAAFLLNQAGKLAGQNERVKEILGETYELFRSGKRSNLDPRAPFETYKGLILSEDGLSLLFHGPLRDILLGKLGVLELELKGDTLKLLSSHQDALDRFEEGERALLWWAMVAEYFESINPWRRNEVITCLQELGVHPPKVL